MGPDRNEEGRFTQKHSDEKVLAAVRTHEPAATSEVADELGISRQGADYRLRRLLDEGRVGNKKIGASLVWFGPSMDSPEVRSSTDTVALGAAGVTTELTINGDERPSSFLLLGSERPTTEEACTSLLSVTDPPDTSLLVVTFDSTPDDRLGIWRTHNGELPKETCVIDVGGPNRSAEKESPWVWGPTRLTTDTVSDPSDLTGLAMAISSYLEASNDIERTPVVCFYSLSALLAHAGQERAFRFLNVVTGQLREIGAYDHYHMDPTAHAEATINRFSALFDRVVRIDDDGLATMHHRR